jgi:hypothetical protein
MISVLTLTYKRYKILEEAIYSFALQKRPDCEMLIINDAEDVEYHIDLPNVKIFNLKNRFSSISKKLQWGFHQAKHQHIYRLDDDDLLYKNALNIASNYVDSSIDVCRSNAHYLFVNNSYQGVHHNINTGNVYNKDYINSIQFQDMSFGEDDDITFKHGAKIKEYTDITMIYRWGMGTYHVSGMGQVEEQEIKRRVDSVSSESGRIILQPNFAEDYYAKISN